MTTYLGEKAVGIGTIKATIGVAGNVLHDNTLKGNGNTEPLGVDTEVLKDKLSFDDKYVKKSGDTITGDLVFDVVAGGYTVVFQDSYKNVNTGNIDSVIKRISSSHQTQGLIFSESKNGTVDMQFTMIADGFFMPRGNRLLGNAGFPWNNIYAKKLNNGADIAIPTEGGTLARIEDLQNATTTLNAGIAGNAQAIQKTREDYIQADSEIHQILNNHAGELTALRGNQASLGDQVSNIESKIPQSASGSNPLVTKQQLLDEEMDIRDDLNESASELQSQITAQAGAIAGKVDVSGDTMTGALTVPELSVATSEGALNLSVTAGVATIATNNGLDIVSPTKFDTAPTTDDNTSFSNALDTSLVRKAQVLQAIGNLTSISFERVANLPDIGQEGVIYLVPKDGELPDVHDEYIWVDGAFEKIGSTQIDLTGYVKNTDYATSANAGLVRCANTYGMNLAERGLIQAVNANLDTYNARGNAFFIGKGTLENVLTQYSKAPTVTEQNENSVELADNTIYNATEIASLTITFPTVDILYTSQLNFTSGATATAFTAPATIKWAGDSIVDGAFVPETNKRYVILFYYDGVNICAIAKGE